MAALRSPTTKEVPRGTNVLASTAKTYKRIEAGQKADERILALAKDPELSKELAAQRTLDGLVGGLDMPKEKLKSKERTAKAAQLESLTRKLKDDAPHTSALAGRWAKVMTEDRKSGH